MGTQVLCLGVLTMNHGCVTPGSGSGNCTFDPRCSVFGDGSPWRLLMCDCRCRVCKGCHTRDCRYLTPGTESGWGVTLETVEV